MRAITPLLLLLAACPAAVEPGGDEAPTPDPGPGPGVELRFVEPGDEAANPVTFRVEGPAGMASVRYILAGTSTLGTSEEADDGFRFTWSFQLLGDRQVEAWAFDATGEFLDDARTDVHVLPDPDEANDFGVWIEDPYALGMAAAELAGRLGDLGVSRAYIKAADGPSDCADFPAMCDRELTDALRAADVEPWAWAVSHIDSLDEQAQLLFDIVPGGYHGLIFSLDSRWAGVTDPLDQLALSYVIARSECDTTGEHLGGEFPLVPAVSADPGAEGVRIDLIDPRVDGYVPRLGPDEDAAAAFCAIRAAGGTKAVAPVFGFGGPLSVTEGSLAAAGRAASFSPVPSDGDPAWAALEAIPWSFEAFVEPACE